MTPFDTRALILLENLWWHGESYGTGLVDGSAPSKEEVKLSVLAHLKQIIGEEVIGEKIKPTDTKGMTGDTLDMTMEYNRYTYYGNLMRDEQRTKLGLGQEGA